MLYHGQTSNAANHLGARAELPTIAKTRTKMYWLKPSMDASPKPIEEAIFEVDEDGQLELTARGLYAGMPHSKWAKICCLALMHLHSEDPEFGRSPDLEDSLIEVLSWLRDLATGVNFSRAIDEITAEENAANHLASIVEPILINPSL